MIDLLHQKCSHLRGMPYVMYYYGLFNVDFKCLFALTTSLFQSRNKCKIKNRFKGINSSRTVDYDFVIGSTGCCINVPVISLHRLQKNALSR